MPEATVTNATATTQAGRLHATSTSTPVTTPATASATTTTTAALATSVSAATYHSSLHPPLHAFESPARDNTSIRQKCLAVHSSSHESHPDHVAMKPSNRLTHPRLSASSLPPPPSSTPSTTAMDKDGITRSKTTPKSMAEPDLSPRHLPLPPSPPFDSDSDNEESSSGRVSPLHRPARITRTESEGSSSFKPIIHQQPLPFRVRNHSPSTPVSRPHTSTGVSLSIPPMQRAHSSPGVDSSGRFITPQFYTSHVTPRRPASPLSAGSRRRSPLRSAMEESYPSWSGLAIEPNIPEHAELDLSEDYSHISPIPSYHNTFPRSRRRPASPLQASASAPSLHVSSNTRAISPHTTGTSSPGSAAEKRYYINESYPSTFSYSYSSTSSMPSTPSSFRSRSPSISSLETIEDSPDAEEAAMIAAEEDAKDRTDDGIESGEGRRRGSLEIRASTLRSNKERKRWSVCGAERRADFSLEVIEE